jgi:methionyl-tRNA formyltransferase
VAHAATLAGLPALLAGRPFDCLLSIVNFQKLPAALLRAPRRLAINYHDAPLPRYAGSHATSWALLNGEREHAVTWHVMTGRVDAGDILVQVPVAIEPDDTVLALNARCHEAALDGFRELLAAMEAQALAPRRQDLARRTFFARSRRPTAGCILPFEAPADRLDAMLRALDFGPYPNPLGLPTIALGEAFAVVTEMGVLDGPATADAGTVTAIADDALVVATATQDVELGGFLSLEGVPLSVAEVAARGGLRVGGPMPSLGADRAARLQALCEGLAPHEQFWLAQFARARPLDLPGLAPDSGAPEVAYCDVPVDPGSRAFLAGLGLPGGDGLVAAFVAFLAALDGSAAVDIGFSEPRLHMEIGDLHGFFATCVPLCVETAGTDGFGQLAPIVARQLARVRAHRSYGREAPLRDPALRATLEATIPATWPVGVELHDRIVHAPAGSPGHGRVLTLLADANGDRCLLRYDARRLAHPAAERLSQQLLSLLRRLPDHVGEPLHAWFR